MCKLTTNQIHEINTVLEGAGVYYADIRMELTDHIASIMERDGFNGNIEAYVQLRKDEIQEFNDTAEAMAMHRNFRSAVAETTKPGFWLVSIGLMVLGEVLLYFTSKDTAGITVMFIAMAVLLITAYNPVFRGSALEFSAKKYYKITDRILVIASLGLLNYSVKTDHVHIVLAGYSVIAAVGYAFYVATRIQVAKYKSNYYA